MTLAEGGPVVPRRLTALVVMVLLVVQLPVAMAVYTRRRSSRTICGRRFRGDCHGNLRRFLPDAAYLYIAGSAPAYVDWDDDGVFDLAVGDAYGRVQWLKRDKVTNEYEDSPSRRRRRAMTEDADCGPLVNVSVDAYAVPAFVDWDGDQDLDLAVGSYNGSIQYWERLGPDHLEQRLGEANPFGDLDTPKYSSPAFADWDEDGDLDLLVGGIDGRLHYFENIEGALRPQLGKHNPFYDIVFREGYSAPAFVDWDGDGDLDLLVGGDSVLTLYERVAAGWLSEKAAMNDEDSSIFANLNGRVKPTVLIRNGSWQELGVTNMPYNKFERLSALPPRLALVERVGVNNLLRSVDTRDHTFDPYVVNSMRMPRIVAPAIMPWNMAGELEVVLGDNSHTLRFFKQIRTGVMKELKGSDNPFDSFSLGPNSRPSICDWFGNGSVNIFVGLESGAVHLFEKKGPCHGGVSGEVVPLTLLNGTRQDPFRDIAIRHAAPVCVDVDGDQDMDLVVGGADGRLRYFQRSGSNLTEVALHESPFRQVDESDGDAMPTFLDADGDGDADLLVGNAAGDTRLYILSSKYSVTEYRRQWPDSDGWFDDEVFSPEKGAMQAAPVAVDIDRDGDMDVVLGLVGSNLRYFSQSFCDQLEPCDSRGNCDGITGTCACIPGHALPSCTTCLPNYFTLQKDHVGDLPTCMRCHKNSLDQICSNRGTCLDDNSVSNNSSLSESQLLIAHGSGECICNDVAFSGTACERGHCPAGAEEIVDESRMTATCVPCPRGEYSDAGVACKVCHVGMPNERQTACEECDGGKFAIPGEASCRLNPVFAGLAALCFLVELLAVFAVLRVLGRHATIADISDMGDRLVVQTAQPHRIKFLMSKSAKVRLVNTGSFFLDHCTLRAKVLDSMRLEVSAPDCKPKTPGVVEASMGQVQLVFPGCIRHTRMISIRTTVWLFVMLPLPYVSMFLYHSDDFNYYTGMSDTIDRVHGEVVRENVLPSAMLGGLAGMFLAALSHLMRWLKKTPMEAELNAFQRKLLAENPDPQSTEMGSHRAVTMEQMMDLEVNFRSYTRERTAYYLVPNVILPLTKKKALSYSELVSTSPQCLVYFVSHYWGTPFAHFVAALRRHAEGTGRDDWPSLAYWVCFLSNNQWRIPQELGEGDWKKSSFYKALRSGHCAATCMVLDDQALPLTRSWCLFEVLQTYSLQRAGMAFEGLRFCTKGGVLGTPECTSYDIVMALGARLVDLDLAEASASNHADEEMIKNLVDAEGGIQQMNKFIRVKMMDALREAQQNFVQRTTELNRDLAELPKNSNETEPIIGKHCARQEGFLTMLQAIAAGDMPSFLSCKAGPASSGDIIHAIA